ncbi:MAG TPA: PQQ-dependent sugar dehydrogenase [Chloroflexota bacterium]
MRQTVDPSSWRIQLDPFVTGLVQPTHVTNAGDGSGRLFLTERAGRIVIVRDGQLVPGPFLDIRDRVGSANTEQGLLSVAFHPQYAQNGALFVDYTDKRGDTVVARYSVSDDPDRANPDSGQVLLHIAQPAANHNGGLLVFGPDGYLYVGMGDGGGAGDQFHNAQNLGSLLGKLLRLDVDSGDPYGIPPDNPFIGSPGSQPEVWAYGLRNPWRYSFDRETGDLIIADVGQNRYEWIQLHPAGTAGGQNYGWPIWEGLHCYPSGSACDRTGVETPIAEYGHDLGCSVTGGFVYRGQAFPAAQGVYFFADFCSGRIWSLDPQPDGSWRQTELLRSGKSVSTFGEDESGELYVASLDPGVLYRLVVQ